MKLYTNVNGEWFGTKADAKAGQYPWVPVDVPTDKPSLIEWLNNNTDKPNQVEWLNNRHHIRVEHLIAETPETVTQQPVMKQHPWQSVREMAEQASLRDLGVVLAVVMNRLEEAAEREET